MVGATIAPGATGTLFNTASYGEPVHITDTDPSNNTATDDNTLLMIAATLSEGAAIDPRLAPLATQAIKIVLDSDSALVALLTHYKNSQQQQPVGALRWASCSWSAYSTSAHSPCWPYGDCSGFSFPGLTTF